MTRDSRLGLSITVREPPDMSPLFQTTAAYPNALVLLITEDDPAFRTSTEQPTFCKVRACCALAVQHDLDGDVELRITHEAPLPI